MLAWDVGNIQAGAADDACGIVELAILGKMGDVARVDHEGGLHRKRLYLVDRFRQRVDGGYSASLSKPT